MTPYNYPTYAAAAATNPGFMLYANAFYNPANQLHQSAAILSNETNNEANESTGYDQLIDAANNQFYPSNNIVNQTTTNEENESTNLNYSTSLPLPELNEST